MNELVRMISEDGTLYCLALNSTEMVREMQNIHNTSKVCSAALGRLITGASMMGVLLKGEKDTLTLKISGGGPASPVVAVTNSKGQEIPYGTWTYEYVTDKDGVVDNKQIVLNFSNLATDDYIVTTDADFAIGSETLEGAFTLEGNFARRFDLAILGENGCGKTTFLELITGDNKQVYSNDIWIFSAARSTP